MNEKKRTCCFVGEKMKGANEIEKEALKKEIQRLITEENIYQFICGMAACELMAAEAVIEVSKDNSSVVLTCVLPYEEHAARWRTDVREQYFNILENCDFTIILQSHYDKGCYTRQRNLIYDAANYALCLNDLTFETKKQLESHGITYGSIPVCCMEAIS